jgi:hypothetical protein
MMATRSKSAGSAGDAISGASLAQTAFERRPGIDRSGALSLCPEPLLATSAAPAATRPREARLLALLHAAQQLVETLENETTPDGFNLVTALQCVLMEAESIARHVADEGTAS